MWFSAKFKSFRSGFLSLYYFFLLFFSVIFIFICSVEWNHYIAFMYYKLFFLNDHFIFYRLNLLFQALPENLGVRYHVYYTMVQVSGQIGMVRMFYFYTQRKKWSIIEINLLILTEANWRIGWGLMLMMLRKDVR